MFKKGKKYQIKVLEDEHCNWHSRKKKLPSNGNMMLLDSFTDIFMANKIFNFFHRFRLRFRLETTRPTENLFRHVLLGKTFYRYFM